MNWKSLTLLLILTGAAVWGVLVLQREQPPPAQIMSQQPLFPELQDQLNLVSGMRIVGTGSGLIADLKNTDSGWVVANRHDYPADLERIREPLIKFAAAQIIELKTANTALYDRIGVQNIDAGGGLLVEIDTPRQTYGLIIGDPSSLGGQTHVRQPESVQSLLVSGDLRMPTETRQWLRQPIVDFPTERFRRIVIRHADGEILTLDRPEPEAINLQLDALPAGRALQYASVANPIGNVLSGLRLEDVLPIARLLAESPASLVETEFLGFDGLRITARIINSGEQRYLTLRAAADPGTEAGNIEAEAAALDQQLADWAFIVTPYAFDNLSQRLDDLLEPITDPEPSE